MTHATYRCAARNLAGVLRRQRRGRRRTQARSITVLFAMRHRSRFTFVISGLSLKRRPACKNIGQTGRRCARTILLCLECQNLVKKRLSNKRHPYQIVQVVSCVCTKRSPCYLKETKPRTKDYTGILKMCLSETHCGGRARKAPTPPKRLRTSGHIASSLQPIAQPIPVATSRTACLLVVRVSGHGMKR